MLAADDHRNNYFDPLKCKDLGVTLLFLRDIKRSKNSNVFRYLKSNFSKALTSFTRNWLYLFYIAPTDELGAVDLILAENQVVNEHRFDFNRLKWYFVVYDLKRLTPWCSMSNSAMSFQVKLKLITKNLMTHLYNFRTMRIMHKSIVNQNNISSD